MQKWERIAVYLGIYGALAQCYEVRQSYYDQLNLNNFLLKSLISIERKSITGMTKGKSIYSNKKKASFVN